VKEIAIVDEIFNLHGNLRCVFLTVSNIPWEERVLVANDGARDLLTFSTVV
jgi:hypothetical protein